MKLTTLRPGLSTLPPRLAPIVQTEQDRYRIRDQRKPWRRWYRTARWAKEPTKDNPSYGLRWSILVRDLFTCQACRKLFADTSKLVAHHKIRHDGVERLFWDPNNLECVCADCHNTIKQREEYALARRG